MARRIAATKIVHVPLAAGATEARRQLVAEIGEKSSEIARYRRAGKSAPQGLIDDYQDLVTRLYRGESQFRSMRLAALGNADA